MATLDQVISQMIAADLPPLPPGHPVADGAFHRFGPKNKAWYKLYEYLARNGKRYIHGSFGYWRGSDACAIKVHSDYGGMDPAELERIKRSQAKIAEDEEAKRIKRAEFAANRAREQYERASPAVESAYLKRKGVGAEPPFRFDAERKLLLVPMVRYDITEEQLKDPDYRGPKRLAGLQKIGEDGSKLFNKGMAKEGCACRLGAKPKEGELILVAEGAATALSIRQAIGRSRAVYIAFDAGNLAAVAKILRKLYPKSPFLFCADDDAYLNAYVSKRMRAEWGASEDFEAGMSTKTYAAKDGELTVDSASYMDADGIEVLTGLIRLMTPEGATRSRTFVMQNPGRTKAHAAAKESGIAAVCFPVFAARRLHAQPEGPRWTDFNDLHAVESLAAVEKQITEAIAALEAGEKGRIELSKQIVEGLDGGGKKKKKGDGRPPAAAGGQGGSPANADFWEKFWELVDRFTWIYPTETAYDHELGDIVGVNPMRLQFGRGYMEMWLESKKRRTVNLEDVVFDPTGAARWPKLNLYRGMAVEPKKGECAKLIELLTYLCGDDSNVFEWVLKWLAYPLQHPGAKMHTALVFAGKQRVGKNLFFGVYRDIFGRHGGMITQRELEDKFNLWLSAKLFLIANEVVTRSEMGHHTGFLKHLITEPEIWINRKMRDARMEENHVNLVFFSNELQPLQLDPDDGRYVVIRTPPKRDKEFYREVMDEVRAGGAAALHQYLLEVQLGDFDVATEPIETQAKRDLIEIGMNSAQLFWRDIHDEEIPLPYCPALVQDLFRCYAIWCKRNLEKMPMRINRFTPAFMTLNGVKRITPRIPPMSRSDQGGWYQTPMKMVKRRTFVMGEPPAGADQDAQDAWVREGVLKFANAADAYCRGEHEESIW